MSWSKFLQGALWLALIGAMAGSVQHVAWSFATLSNGNMAEGYIQAVAVDIGIAALAFGVQLRKRTRRPTAVLWGGVILFSLVSTYANLLYGLAHQRDIGVGWLASLRPYIMSAVLPAMVIYLSEVVSEDVQHAAAEADKLRRRERQATTGEPRTNTVKARRPDMTKEQALNAALSELTTKPDISVSQLASRIGKSRGTVYNYLDELERQGRISRDGSGSVVVQSNGRKVTA